MQYQCLVCVHVCMCMYTCVHRCTRPWVHECGSGRTALGFIPQLLPTLFPETGSLSGLQLAKKGGLTHWRAARVPHLCLPSAMPCFLMWFWRLNKLNCSGLYGSKPFTSTAMSQPTCFCLLIWAFLVLWTGLIITHQPETLAELYCQWEKKCSVLYLPASNHSVDLRTDFQHTGGFKYLSDAIFWTYLLRNDEAKIISSGHVKIYGLHFWFSKMFIWL